MLNALLTPDASPPPVASRILVAVSGGPDSLALLHALHAQRDKGPPFTVLAAHFNHGLRGDESEADAAFVVNFCLARDIPCLVGKTPIVAGRDGPQAAARTARLAFLEETAARMRADCIATGHTADDQAETVLLHLLRGAGLDGLAGIPARRGLYVRPLLSVTRAEIETYCAAHGLFPRRDSSNFDASHYARNKVRLELLPLLARDFNPAVKGALVRLAEIAARDADFLRQHAEAVLPSVTLAEDERRLTLDSRILRSLHPGLLRHVLRAAIGRRRGTLEGITFDHVEKIAAAVLFPPAAPFGLTLPAPPLAVRVTMRRVALTRPLTRS